MGPTAGRRSMVPRRAPGGRMTTMDDLITFVRAQLDEDERVARGITAPEWNEGCSWLADLRDPLPSQRRAYGLPKEWQLLTEADTRHIARWDPARVLAEVAAKRAILDWCEGSLAEIRRAGIVTGDPLKSTPLYFAALLARPYAGREGWRAEWAV